MSYDFEGQVDVLLVEDDPLILETLSEALSDAGLDTVRRATAEAALEVLGQDMPRVVVTDINLGAGMDGLEFGRQVRQRFPGLPFVYISGRYAEVLGLESQYRFLPKPFSASRLLRMIADLSKPVA